MNSDHQSKEQELKNLEAELKEREIKVRMRELESEIETSTSVKPTVKHKGAVSFGWYNRLPKLVQFGLLVVGVIIAIRVATWLSGVLLLFAVGWVIYKLFLERSRN
ncbi:hypothetical protein QGP82_14245 [Leptothoe sp. LEGE 181152]|nr:hypothetical protein [Leptothoe sp. LEGE 181152]